MADPTHRQVTPDELKRDAANIAQQVHDAWDGEVEVVVLLVPKAQIRPDVCAAQTIASIDRYLEVLRRAIDGARLPVEMQRTKRRS